MLTPHVHEIRHAGCSPYAPLAAAPQTPAPPRCGGTGILQRAVGPIDPLSGQPYGVDDHDCPGCVDCLQDGDPVECAQCAWNDGDQLVVEDTPAGRRVTGDEGEPHGFCPECGECFDIGHGVHHDNARRRFA